MRRRRPGAFADQKLVVSLHLPADAPDVSRWKAEESGARQRERIKALTAECEAAKKEAGALRAREEQIKTTLMSATEQAEAAKRACLFADKEE